MSPKIAKATYVPKSFSKKPPTIPKIKATKLKPAIKAVKKDSLDSLPDMAGIDPFDRAKTPDPKAPGTLVYGLKEVENSKTKSFKAIEKYYASKSATNVGDEETGTKEEHEETIEKVEPTHLYTNEFQRMHNKGTEERSRNSILFPNMSQQEIDDAILVVCESR